MYRLDSQHRDNDSIFEEKMTCLLYDGKYLLVICIKITAKTSTLVSDYLVGSFIGP